MRGISQHWTRLSKGWRSWAVVVLALLAALGLGYLLAAPLGVGWDAYWSGALPAFAAIAGGVPIALRLAQLGEEGARKRETEAAAARRSLVLEVIRNELRENLDELQGVRAQRPRLLVIPSLKDEVWRALGLGGELRWVDDPELIERLARAYHRISTTTFLEQRMFDPTAGTIVERGTGLTTRARLARMADDQDEHTIAAIDHALAGIKTALRED